MKRFSILIAALCLCLTGCGKQTTEATAQIFAMDTVMEVAAYGPTCGASGQRHREKDRRVGKSALPYKGGQSMVSGLNQDGSIRHY
ncbi:MAG: hypothetical protein ACLUS6_08910 [Dysosmobacter sp.]